MSSAGGREPVPVCSLFPGTLLLGNTLVNALIAILAASFTSGLVGGLLSTGFILIFGEIIPQAYCSRNALRIGALSVPLGWAVVVVLSPITFPISLLLDRLLGREVGAVFTRRGLLALVRLNREDDADRAESGLTLEDG